MPRLNNSLPWVIGVQSDNIGTINMVVQAILRAKITAVMIVIVIVALVVAMRMIVFVRHRGWL